MTARHERQLEAIRQWATANEDIRVMLLTSSLVNPAAPVDQFSDLDIELVVKDLPSFLKDDSWVANFGDVLAVVVENEDAFDGLYAMRMVMYNDISKVDFRLYSIPRFREDVAKPSLPEDWDVGYKVLIDKDGLTTGMPPPSYASTLVQKPSNERFQTKMLDYWWDMECAAKCLCRDELFYAKYVLEVVMRSGNLQVLLEWYTGLQHNWQVSTNKNGRLFKKFLSPDMWKKVEATCSGSDMDDNWRALLAFADLGSEIGPEIAQKLGYTYPAELERKIREYLETVRKM